MKRSLFAAAAAGVLTLSIVLPLAASAMEGTTSSATMMHETKKTVDGACMAAAVTARDTAISGALTPVVTAIQTRGTALAAAWNLTDLTARKAAVKAANAAFEGTWKKFNETRKGAWKTFYTAAKACKVAPAETGVPSTSAAM